jgi:ankyrin repeat protein
MQMHDFSLRVLWIVPVCAAVGLCATNSTRLVEAAKAKDTAAVRALIKDHADVNAMQGDGATALHWAAHWDDRDTVQLLLAAGARVNVADDDGVTALSLACLNGSPTVVDLLLRANANPNLAKLNGETPLMTASLTGNARVVKLLLAHSAEVNAREATRGQNALMWAVAKNHPDVVRVLLEGGADVKARSKTQFTALLFAAQQGDLESARMLLEAGADANDTAPDGIAGDTNARASFKPNTQAGALLVAIDSGHQDMARFLIERGADINQHGAGRTPLHAAVQQRMPDLLKLLLARGADPNARLEKPLPLLSRYILQAAGLDPSALGATPFWMAADFGDIRTMRILAEGGANPLLTTNDKTTPLMAAAGIDFIEGQDRYGRRWFQESTMPLQLAALDAIKYCLELGGDINAANSNGQTAMHGASYMGSTLIIQFLFDHGARMDVMNKLGQTPYFITQGIYQAGSFMVRKEAGDLLKKLGADPLLGLETARKNTK